MKKYIFNLGLSLVFLVASNGLFTNDNSVAYDPSGTWNVEIETPQGTQDGVMKISKDKDGEFEVIMEDTNGNDSQELQNVSFDEDEKLMTGEVEAEGYTLDMEINFDGDTLEGTILVESFEITFTGEREK